MERYTEHDNIVGIIAKFEGCLIFIQLLDFPPVNSFDHLLIIAVVIAHLVAIVYVFYDFVHQLGCYFDFARKHVHVDFTQHQLDGYCCIDSGRLEVLENGFVLGVLPEHCHD